MKRWAFIHPASGACLMVTTIATMAAPSHLDRRPAPTGVDPGTHWWNGWSFAPRVDAAIATTRLGDRIAIACPGDAFVALPDGAIGTWRNVAAPAGRARIVLVGKYRGESWIEMEGAA